MESSSSSKYEGVDAMTAGPFVDAEADADAIIAEEAAREAAPAAVNPVLFRPMDEGKDDDDPAAATAD